MNKLRLSTICLLLCLALTLTLAGCRHTPADPTGSAPTTVAPTQPSDPSKPTTPAQAYTEAANFLDATNGLSLEIEVNTTISVADDLFRHKTIQEVFYSNRKSGSPSIRMVEAIRFGTDEMPNLEETYIDGMLYVRHDNNKIRFRGPIDREAWKTRYVPPVMLTASLYESITSTSNNSGTTYAFSKPTGAEPWALPEGAVLSEASGTATTNILGALTQMRYSITYFYGGAQVRMEYESKISNYSGNVAVYGSPDNYTEVENVELFRYYPQALGYLYLSQPDSAIVNASESIASQAAGILKNQSITMNRYGTDKDISTVIETDVYLMNYGTNQEQTYTLEEKFLDREYTAAENGGTPVRNHNVSYSDVVAYCREIYKKYSISPISWETVTCTDLGSTILIEYVLTDTKAQLIQDEICQALWNDPDFLNNLASTYVTNEGTGYFAIDKFSGLPTAMGYYYSGTHTIQGGEYLLTMQADQSVEVPGVEAYHNITDEHRPDMPPGKKPTPLFYHVTGKDGQEMWLLGTIHIGDARTAYLPKEIYDAFAASDALAIECNNDLFEEQVKEDDALQEKLSEVYYYTDGATLESVLGEELYEAALKYMKASGNYNMNAPYMKPFAWESALTDFYTRQAYSLMRSKGVESRLIALAEEQNKSILEVESVLFQLEMMGNFSSDLQVYMLMSILKTDFTESREELLELYDLWCAGDEAALRKAVSTKVDTATMTDEEKAEYEQYKHLIDEYNKAMNGDRNKGMLEVAKSYLESDQVVFYAVGLAHLLSEDGGLVDALRAAGYTVELVQYK